MLWSGYYEHVDLSDNSNKSQVKKLGEENSEDNYAKYADNICENICKKTIFWFCYYQVGVYVVFAGRGCHKQ